MYITTNSSKGNGVAVWREIADFLFVSEASHGIEDRYTIKVYMGKRRIAIACRRILRYKLGRRCGGLLVECHIFRNRYNLARRWYRKFGPEWINPQGGKWNIQFAALVEESDGTPVASCIVTNNWFQVYCLPGYRGRDLAGKLYRQAAKSMHRSRHFDVAYGNGYASEKFFDRISIGLLPLKPRKRTYQSGM